MRSVAYKTEENAMTRKRKTGHLELLFVVLCGGAFSPVHAKTVALWKLDYSPYTGMNTRCLVDSANDFDVVIQGQQKEPPSSRPALPSGMSQDWSPLPPNPDATAGLLDTTFSTNAIYYPHGILFSSTGVVSAVNSSARSFTIEGWFWRQNWYVPSIGSSTPFFSVGKMNGWQLSLYNLDDTNTLYFIISDYRSPNNMTKRFPVPVTKAATFTKWCHNALVYNSAGGGGLGTWEVFVNSQSCGVVTNNSNQVAPGLATGFYLGGDGFNSQYFNAGGYDYWRISDQALATNQFLNAGTPVVATSPKTLAFYRLDVNADGTLDLTNRAANAYHLQAPVGNVASQVTANADQAVASVPNPDASAHFFGNRTVNQGSLSFRTGTTAGAKSYLYSYQGLGYYLGTNSAWTIESWIKFTALSSRQVIFTQRAEGGLGTGWMLMNYSGLSSRYSLWFGANPSYIGFPGSVGGTAETSLNVWHHLALTFDPASGPGYQGAWECFLDGRSLGTILYSNSYDRINTSANFLVGGRVGAYGDDSVYGSMDLVRVTQGVLATNRFLNAGGYVATTNAVATAAYWKLDSDGASVDASSQVDPRYALGVATNTVSPAGSLRRVAGALSKHDATPGFIGDPAANAGSLLFTNGTALTTGNLGVKLELDAGFTVEGWMNWDGGADRGVQALAGTRFDTAAGWVLPAVGTANRVLFDVPSGWLLTLEKRGTDAAFHIACNTAVTNAFTGSDAVIDSDLAVLPVAQLAGQWRHVALAYAPDVGDRGRWTFYLNGVETGFATNAVAPFFNHESHRFLLGGRAGGTNSFDGLLDCWRASSGLRAPADLLCFSIPRGTLIRVQ
jgi:hypothetical protein